MKLVLVIKVYWLFMVSVIVYVILFGVINEMFNFCIINVLRKLIICNGFPSNIKKTLSKRMFSLLIQ